MHGGPVGFDAVVWTKIDEPTIFTKAEVEKLNTLDPKSYAIFRLTSSDGDQGYPGQLTAETLIVLVNGGEVASAEQALGGVTIVYRAKLDGEATVSPVNLTQVSYLPPATLLRRSFNNPALGIQPRCESSGTRNNDQRPYIGPRGELISFSSFQLLTFVCCRPDRSPGDQGFRQLFQGLRTDRPGCCA